MHVFKFDLYIFIKEHTHTHLLALIVKDLLQMLANLITIFNKYTWMDFCQTYLL